MEIQGKNCSVGWEDLSFFRSKLVLYVGTAVIGAGLLTALPFAASALGVVIPTGLLIALAIKAGLIWSYFMLLQRHELIYEVSLLYTVWNKQRWWTQISPDVILGALPLKRHVHELKQEGVTHVITLLDHFELNRGIVHPATRKMWEKQGITQIHETVTDFYGVPPLIIGRVLRRMDKIRRTEKNAKFYIHCKAGRGRSASVVVADRIASFFKGLFPSRSISSVMDQEIGFVKNLREQINLNSFQRGCIRDYFLYREPIDYTKVLL